MMSAFFKIFSVIYRNFRKNCKLTLYANRFPVTYIVNTLTATIKFLPHSLPGKCDNRP
jgi:hypothetical protein